MIRARCPRASSRVGVGVGGGLGVLDADRVAVGEAVELGGHQAGHAVLAGEDPEVGADRAAHAHDAREVAEDRRRQRAAGVVDDRDRVLRHALGQHLHHLLDVGDVAGGAADVGLRLEDVVAGADDRAGPARRSRSPGVGDARQRFVFVRLLLQRDRRRDIEPVALGEQVGLDLLEVLAGQLQAPDRDRLLPRLAARGEPLGDQLADRGVVRLHGRGHRGAAPLVGDGARLGRSAHSAPRRSSGDIG